MEYKESYAAKRKKNLEKRACLDNYNTYLYHSEVYKINMDILSLILKKIPPLKNTKIFFSFHIYGQILKFTCMFLYEK
jgi:hypothetical protein